MSQGNCNICNAELGAPCYESQHSLTSLCRIFPQPTVVRVCEACGHLQTQAIDDLAGFYDDDYDILTGSEEEDQIYEVTDSGTVYRTEHQIDIMLDKVSLPQTAKILDFGCAKGSVMRVLKTRRKDIEPFLYDISDRYIEFWKTFAKLKNCATYTVPNAWEQSFDLVTSFFSLEHIADPRQVLGTIRGLLKPDGILYGIVPNVLTNSADLIVIDHVNHFTASSLSKALSMEGYEIVDIDEQSHRGAFVFSAKKTNERQLATARSAVDPRRELAQISELSAFWTNAVESLQKQEASLPEDDSSAIYGAGFYGSFIHTALKHPERVGCFMDQNKFLQGSTLAEKPIIAPADLPVDIRNVYVGLNPVHARTIIESVVEFQSRNLNYLFM